MIELIASIILFALAIALLAKVYKEKRALEAAQQAMAETQANQSKALEEDQDKDAQLHFWGELFNMLANTTNDIYIVIKADGYTVEYVSPNIERILGVPRESAIADLYSIQTPTYLDGTPPTREQLLAVPVGSHTVRESRRTHRSTGERIAFMETTYHMVIDGVERLVTIISDRTTDRMQQSALEEALLSAKAANDAKTTFLSNVSHDIRTPMNAIVGITELLEQSPHDPEFVAENVNKIKQASHHLLGLINDVLDMSKIENGTTVLNLEAFNLSDVVAELERVIGPQAAARNQQLSFHVESDVPKCFIGDKLRIGQIFMNILSNAVKYTPEHGTVCFEVESLLSNHETQGIAHLRFIVSDNGIGMSGEFQKHVFDAFARENKSLVNEMQGTGLGMPIAKTLAELMGGSISVKSEQGMGSVFTVDLSLRVEEHPLVEKPPAQGVDIAGMNFLIAEDVDINAEVLKQLLSLKQATCDIAENGKVAAEMFLKKPIGTYDAILMDVQMPIMDGYEATRVIRASARGDARTIPIIAMTANAFLEDRNEAMAAGMDAHLAKPASIAQLCETLGLVLQKKR